MKIVRALLFLPLFLLISCGVDPEPKYLEGEDVAATVVTRFLGALEKEDYQRAEAYLYPKADYILRDLPHCRDLFYSAPPSGMSVIRTGKELYGREWQIFVDLKINYGSQMKQIHFTLTSGEAPKLRGMNPLVP
ncbi:hypothetical protein VDG1235_4692 [Verrucomicrobiia bacterium DG1235]|nr:hypothetical protein VDG1235_4692 [Verrucomicrobiae bacterium DG1235]